ncbi:MAG TPA: hypothetical protein VIB79_13870 [Candidatus Binatia bacterium]
MKRMEKARDIKSGEIVHDRGIRFIIKEVWFGMEPNRLGFLDIEGLWHGNYHPDEYLGVGEVLELN